MYEIISLPFMQNALLASAMIGVLCAILGVYIVLRRIVFFSAVISQVSSMGIALAFVIGINPHLTAFVLTLLAITLFAIKRQGSVIPQDGFLGVTYTGAFALSILFIARLASGDEVLHYLLQGNILTVTTEQLYILLVTFIVVGAIHIAFYKEFIFVSFDEVTAQTLGHRVTRWNLLLYITMGMVISFGLRISGVLLIFAFLVIPVVTALLVAKRMRSVFAIAILTNLIAVVTGIYLSFHWDLPSGPTIVAVLLVPLLAALLFRRR